MAYTLLVPAQSPLDSDWFEQILPLNDELYTTLSIPSEQLAMYREQFAANQHNPDLRPLHTQAAIYENRNRSLGSLQKRVCSSSLMPEIITAYSTKIDELVLQNKLVIASLANDKSAIRDYNRQLYGVPDTKKFAGACAWLRHIASDAMQSDFPAIANAAEHVLLQLPELGGTQHDIIPPSHVFKQVRDAHFADGGFINQLFGTTTIPDTIDATIGDDIVRQAIKSIGSNYMVASSEDELWGVLHSRKLVVRPDNYSLSGTEFMGIVAHEIGSHLLERENGLRQPLKLLSIGLDRYESSNEGRAFLREQIMHHSPDSMLTEPSWEYIVLLYVSTALAEGIHGEPFDFVSLYRTLLPVCSLLQHQRMPDNPAIAALRAEDEAWSLCIRAAKGTDGTGGAYSKALVYLDGNLKNWQLAAENPEYIFYSDNGKFDATRQDHRDVLTACGIAGPWATKR